LALMPAPPIDAEGEARPPRDNLVRGLAHAYELRDGGEDHAPTLFGHFAVFNEWTEIDSLFEGNFLERIAPGAFMNSIAQNRDQVRVLFQHGMDPQLGDKPIASIDVLKEDERGAYYEAPLLEGLPPLLVSGLRTGQYGASFRFRVEVEDWNKKPKPDARHNPAGLPERTIRQARLFEFGPVTFPAYPGATAAMRSLTDEYIARRAAVNPLLPEFTELRELVGALRQLVPKPDSTESQPAKPRPVRKWTPTKRKEYLEWLSQPKT
jgi:HK97 family phage prohead protease